MTRRWNLWLLTLLLTWGGFANGSAPPEHAKPPAGMILYCRQGDEVYLLLADHRTNRRGWAGFGGRADAGESVAETAARETEEETRGYFKRAELMAGIRGQEPYVHGSFHLFFLEVKAVPIEAIESIELPQHKLGYLERGPFAWIPYKELQRAYGDSLGRAKIRSTYLPERGRPYFWRHWLEQMQEAERQGRLPWMR